MRSRKPLSTFVILLADILRANPLHPSWNTCSPSLVLSHGDIPLHNPCQCHIQILPPPNTHNHNHTHTHYNPFIHSLTLHSCINGIRTTSFAWWCASQHSCSITCLGVWVGEVGFEEANRTGHHERGAVNIGDTRDTALSLAKGHFSDGLLA